MEVQCESDGHADGEGNGMYSADVEHCLPFDAINLFVKCKGDKGGAMNMISSDEGIREAEGSNKGGDIR